jgi:hypothetical protein
MEKVHFQDKDIDARTVLKWILEIRGWEGVNWIHLALDRDGVQAVLNKGMNPRVPQNVAKFLSSDY